MKTIFQKAGAREVFGNQESALVFIRGVDYQDFKDYLTRINGVILGLSKTERGTTNTDIEFGNSRSGDVEYLPPNPEDKEELLRKVFEAGKTLRDPKDIGLLIYLSLQDIHPFLDGNGRTGRAVYNLLAQTDPPVEGRAEFAKKCVKPPQDINNEIYRLMIPELFGEDFFKKYGNISSYLANGFVDIPDRNIPKPLKLQVGRILGEVARAGVVNPIKFRDLVVLRFLQQKRELSLATLPYHPLPYEPTIQYGEDEGKHIFSVDGNSLKSLSKEELEILVTIHRELKIQFIQKLIDVIANPSAYKREGNPIKDDFLQVR
ncbi:hypothetical protein COT44_01500 [Candidatus Shapirobacteria bacterium CG08_land_8_20_14_0_20_39_18]|uniref:Fido domain-containing protein n=1 Tax=Candidatus Shapirobacteria bacterium CG08_land_8_20_14_0_20_39_18 TaxID=1974883 RepID=A0A2M6XDL6_9BACT|nr:MAG: hypothetical protein COT44_01500 [Candidatus Shapirobacteria bacterium CG08_land_8_20_14_0_20_39_18]PIY65150.1 MAG: hypothetical protein COY91_03760 [Candidatus Shapirobacteria bacterium CG_4_10_14_0_8_um_filter_39_15]PJE68006.1 MAG: hypothetical protein COU94_04195 [Candidatus Shapirobacteria bacterium CG10_big_fil_rev_8_21_14_0_10_38_8]